MKFKILNIAWALLLTISSMGLLTSMSPLRQNAEESPEIWLIHQDFFSFGKRDVYEAIKKTWLAELKSTNPPNEILPVVAIQSRTNPEYIYMTPLENFGVLDTYCKNIERVAEKLGSEVSKQQQDAWFSTMNFQVLSLHRYLPLCSCLPLGSNQSIPYRPYVHYFIVSVTPGQSGYFEEYLKRQVVEHNQEGETVCWRVWKALIGADIPKYVIGIFSRSEEDLKKHREQLNLRDPSMLNILRHEREGRGVLRRDLSIMPTGG